MTVLVSTDPIVPSLMHAALVGAAKGALEHLSITPPGAPRRYRTLARAALVGAVLAVTTVVA